MPRLRVPGVIDLLRTDDPAAIAALATDDRLDRRYRGSRAFFNAFLLGRVRRILQDGGKPLPTAAARDDAERQQAQRDLESRLAPLVRGLSAGPPDLDALAAYVRGERERSEVGPIAQTVVGRLFNPGFTATSETWAAAEIFDAAPRSFNLPRVLWWALTGRLQEAGRLLATSVGHDRAGIHAIGIAIHNIVRGLQIMRDLWADPSARARTSPEAAVARCLLAPDHVLRQATQAGTSAAGEFGAGTIVMLDLGRARARSPDRNTIFMVNSWSRCPAHAWVPALLAGTWRNACRKE
jgi:hypothetical protein